MVVKQHSALKPQTMIRYASVERIAKGKAVFYKLTIHTQ